MKPRIPITDPRFRYVPAEKTDIRKRFDELRRKPIDNVTTLPFVRTK